MTDIAYLNNTWLPLAEAKISPLDRGFLFGDGIYEVIPVHHGKPVAAREHISRLHTGLDAIGISSGFDEQDWLALIGTITDKNQSASAPFQGLYLHVSRGADVKRHHSFPVGVTPTVFAFMFEIPSPPVCDRHAIAPLQVGLCEDLRWRRCHIKSTSLLGNVLHYQQGNDQGLAETILFNQAGQVTEASACNVFIVKNNVVITAPLDNQLLPGITRALVLRGLREHTDITVEERWFDKQELLQADEVWLTSSTKEIAPVNEVDGQKIGNGSVGEVWERALAALAEVKYL